jgi:hypothetical protein
MEEKEKIGRPPDFIGQGVSIWINKTSEGRTYAAVQIFGRYGIRVNCFINPKQHTQTATP